MTVHETLSPICPPPHSVSPDAYSPERHILGTMTHRTLGQKLAAELGPGLHQAAALL